MLPRTRRSRESRDKVEPSLDTTTGRGMASQDAERDDGADEGGLSADSSLHSDSSRCRSQRGSESDASTAPTRRKAKPRRKVRPQPIEEDESESREEEDEDADIGRPQRARRRGRQVSKRLQLSMARLGKRRNSTSTFEGFDCLHDTYPCMIVPSGVLANLADGVKHKVSMEGLYQEVTHEARVDGSGGTALVRALRKGQVPGFGALLKAIHTDDAEKIYACYHAYAYACELNGVMVEQELSRTGMYDIDSIMYHPFMVGIDIERQWYSDLIATYFDHKDTMGSAAAAEAEVIRACEDITLALMQPTQGDALKTISVMTIMVFIAMDSQLDLGMAPTKDAAIEMESRRTSEVEKTVRVQAASLATVLRENAAFQKTMTDMMKRMESEGKRGGGSGRGNGGGGNSQSQGQSGGGGGGSRGSDAGNGGGSGNTKGAGGDGNGGGGGGGDGSGSRNRPRNYTGCFTCDSMEHDNRNCPVRRERKARGGGGNGGRDSGGDGGKGTFGKGGSGGDGNGQRQGDDAASSGTATDTGGGEITPTKKTQVQLATDKGGKSGQPNNDD